jgi:hypothetical protein
MPIHNPIKIEHVIGQTESKIEMEEQVANNSQIILKN